MQRTYTRPLHSGFEQVTTVRDEPIRDGKVRVGFRQESEYGGWVRFVVVPRRHGRTLKEARRVAAQHLDLGGDYYSHPGGRYYHRAHMRVGRTRVIFTQRGGYDI